ncbi:MAG: DUF4931 domain-containing protein [Parcubacteria group bacterium]|nr:DUF4931 domain-containing protein [Parcubacteria group bacterium]
MSGKNQIQKSVSELRQDLVSGDWVVIATGRAKRPNFFKEKKIMPDQPVQACPFENPQKSTHGDPFYVSPNLKNWWVQVVGNKYPAFGPGNCLILTKNGPYSQIDGAGFHELVITRDHKRSIAEMSAKEVEAIILAYKNRYSEHSKSECVEYISIFHNHGPAAGASISHPHSQIIAIPVVPPDVGRSLNGSADYFKKNKKRVHDVMLDFEMKEQTRIVYENKDFVSLCPFVSRSIFEVRIFPKKHNPYFEDIKTEEVKTLADILQKTLSKIFKGLNNPSYNFFIHTSPTKDREFYDHYHWHIEILPRASVWGGVELGIGIEILTVLPEDAAEYLRGIKI